MCMVARLRGSHSVVRAYEQECCPKIVAKARKVHFISLLPPFPRSQNAGKLFVHTGPLATQAIMIVNTCKNCSWPVAVS